jgi:phage baseplate assembly protein W
MANLQKIYSDLDLTFKALPVTKDVSMRYDDQAVVASVRNLLLTNFYERPFQPNLGSNMSSLLFEPATNVTATILADEIKNVITNFEPRVRISNISVELSPQGNGFNVFLKFFIGNNTIVTNVNLFLQRSR